jgi:hypothetical protein
MLHMQTQSNYSFNHCILKLLNNFVSRYSKIYPTQAEHAILCMNIKFANLRILNRLGFGKKTVFLCTMRNTLHEALRRAETQRTAWEYSEKPSVFLRIISLQEFRKFGFRRHVPVRKSILF